MFGDAVNGVGRGRRNGLLERRKPFGQGAGDAIAMFGDTAPGLVRRRRDRVLESREPFGQRPGHAVAMFGDAVRAVSLVAVATRRSNAASRSASVPVTQSPCSATRR